MDTGSRFHIQMAEAKLGLFWCRAGSTASVGGVPVGERVFARSPFHLESLIGGTDEAAAKIENLEPAQRVVFDDFPIEKFPGAVGTEGT